MFVIKRHKHNPILKPERNHAWEGFATFNWSPVEYENVLHVLYRAMSLPDPLREGNKQLSTIGHATSKDGEHFENRQQFIVPEYDWEKYGCEDPRISKLDDTYYVFYTALSVFPFAREGIKVALAKTKDFKTIEEKHLITPFNAKAMTLFPEKIDGKITAILSTDTDQPPAKLAIIQFEKEEDMWDEDYWNKWYASLEEHAIDPRRSEFDHVEVGASPIKTEFGWLLIYSHIENYFPNSGHARVFGIEALLLDLNDPTKIIGKTKGPILTPNEYYETAGYVSNVVFPSGAQLKDDMLQIFYGAADTVACVAEVNLKDLLHSIYPATAPKYHFQRHSANPIIIPNTNNNWESKATFNPAAIDLGGFVHILYRAMGHDDTSVIGYAKSKNGLDIDFRNNEPVYVPRADFEIKKRSGNSGCEDPRLVKIDDTIYMFYTAFDAIGPARVSATSISEKDFLDGNFNWSSPSLITPKEIDDKDTCILPRRINDKFVLLHRISGNICIDYLDSLDFENEGADKCIFLLGPRAGMWDGIKVGITAPPLECDEGWLLLYHAVSAIHNSYRVGAVLLDKNDPSLVLARSADPIFQPEMPYEKEGIVSNVVFPCGAIIRDNKVYIYYGGADTVTGVATMDLDIILNGLTRKYE